MRLQLTCRQQLPRCLLPVSKQGYLVGVFLGQTKAAPRVMLPVVLLVFPASFVPNQGHSISAPAPCCRQRLG